MDLPRDFGPYRLLRQIAVGGMAEIYLAKTSGFGGFEKLLALKMIHPKFSEDAHFINMIIEEAKISVHLAHVNIGQVFDLGRIDERYYIAMEYIEGGDVYKLMKRASDIAVDVPIDSSVYVALETCAGLDYAHRKRDSNGKSLGIIHRDMSPQNVIVSYAGEVKIVDFGIAKAALRAQQTEVGIIKGKYYYMSPEQAWGDQVDHRSDIFSTGIILYELLTGEMLYLEEQIDVLLDRVRKADVQPPSTKRDDVPQELDDIVMKALAKYPDDRFDNARDFGHALSEFLYGFYPDYTPARLAGVMSWLLGPEREKEAEQDAARIQKEDGVILTRDDFSKEDVRSAGSLIYRLADMVREEGGLSELDKTSLVSAPPDSMTPDEHYPPTKDATVQLSVADIVEVAEKQRPPDALTPPANAPLWGDDSVDRTLVDPSGMVVRRMAEGMAALATDKASED